MIRPAWTPFWIELGAWDPHDDDAQDLEPPDPWLDAVERLALQTPDDIAEAIESWEIEKHNPAQIAH